LRGGVNPEAEKIIAQLGLSPLPREGGFFRQTWVSSIRLSNGRAAGSAIWFLLTADDFSALHRLPPEELWHFYAGDPVEHVQLGRPAQSRGPVAGLESAGGPAHVTVLGADLWAGQLPQLVVPGGVWQGARLKPGAQAHGWALLGCTVTPAWVDGEFELGERGGLRREFPAATEWLRALTR
jgi:predicted cupin superfamily sugar epimerase